MGHGKVDRLALRVPFGKRRVRRLNAERHRPTHEFQLVIPHQRTRKQACLEQYLKPVADPDGIATLFDVGDQGRGNRGACGDRPAPQVITEGKSARHTDNICVRRQFGVFVPDHGDIGPDRAEGLSQIPVAVRSGEDDDSCFHEVLLPETT